MATSQGVIHGKIIELEQEPGFPDGQRVEVTMTPLPQEQAEKLPPGEGLRRAFGTWAEDAKELDDFLDWNHQQRKIGRREIEE